MIIYFYLSIVILLSIITGIITTIIEAKKSSKKSYVIEGVKPLKKQKEHTELLSVTEEYSQNNNTDIDTDYYTPVIIKGFDQDAI